MNGYITTPGAPAPEVWGMIEDLGFKIEVDHQPAAEKSPSFVLSPSNRSTYSTDASGSSHPCLPVCVYTQTGGLAWAGQSARS